MGPSIVSRFFALPDDFSWSVEFGLPHHSLSDKPAWKTSVLICGKDRLPEPLPSEITNNQNKRLRYLGLER
tara:strand:+ start:1783 stop:1995 length:213 start_codon:yes stop_codon:yes gene_type:complete